ncbi:uncharacterized protein LOC109599580 [Aethina tumida]|uniref:uncharacterized protein LOC109599580 n=1 Tax=Aethina tumida TaxID=116153 RepID=UPI002148E82A|nr:uncharacterized protein LOC109599580 [Aethina tumida]
MVSETSDDRTNDMSEEHFSWDWILFMDFYFILSLICLAADFVIIIAIVKYRRLRNRKSNILILHWTICDATFQGLHPVIFRLSLQGTFQHWYHEIVCILEEFCYTMLMIEVLFVILLTFYWYYEIHDPIKLVKLGNHLTFSVVFVYCFGLFSMGIHIWACVAHSFFGPTSMIISVLGFFAYFLFTVIINIVSAIRRKLNRSTSRPLSNVNFILSNFFFICKFSVLVVCLVSSLFVFHFIGIMAAFLFAVSNSIFNLIILYFRDEDYKVFLKNIFTLKCGRYNDEFVDEPIRYANGDVESRS